MIFLTGLIMFSSVSITNSVLVFGYVTPEQEKLGMVENGDKKAYTDCEGYKEFTESSEISKKEADFGTDAVDKRIAQLQSSLLANDDEDLQEELDCLSAIRAIEKNAIVEMGNTLDDIRDFTDLLGQQQSLNERWANLDEKYGNN